MKVLELANKISGFLGSAVQHDVIIARIIECHNLIKQAIINHQSNMYCSTKELVCDELDADGFLVFTEIDGVVPHRIDMVRSNGMNIVPSKFMFMSDYINGINTENYYDNVFMSRDITDDTKLLLWVNKLSKQYPYNDDFKIVISYFEKEDVSIEYEIPYDLVRLIEYFVYAGYNESYNTSFSNAYRSFSNNISNSNFRW